MDGVSLKNMPEPIIGLGDGSPMDPLWEGSRYNVHPHSMVWKGSA